MVSSERRSALRGARWGVWLTLLAVASLVVPATAQPPLPKQVPTPVLSYDGAGFGAFWKGQIVAVARQGTRHWDDPTGRISLYTFSDGQMDWPPVTLADTEMDDRNAAGGVTPKGALVFFYSRSPGREGPWRDIHAVRIGPDGERTTVQIPTGPDGSFSAHGPLVTLPSGRLMQTLYGWSRSGYRIRAVFSNDDGRTWPQERIIWHTTKATPNETVAAFVDGRTDATARLIAFSRSGRIADGQRIFELVQHVSVDGGMTWRQVGAVLGGTTLEVVPWIANIGRGRLALIITHREHYNLTINVSIANSRDVFTNHKRWPKERPIYRSRLQRDRIGGNGFGQSYNFGDFGYPSVVRSGPRDDQLHVVFYDAHTGYSGYEPYDVPVDTDLYLHPLFAPTI